MLIKMRCQDANIGAQKPSQYQMPGRSGTNPRLRGFTIAITSTGITSESQLQAAGTARPAAARSHLAAAAAGGVFPSALGWNVRRDRLWSCSWGRGPHLQTAAELPAAKASVSHTLCSPGAWSAGRHKRRSQCCN